MFENKGHLFLNLLIFSDLPSLPSLPHNRTQPLLSSLPALKMESANPCGFLVIFAILAAHLVLCSSASFDFGSGDLDRSQLGFFPMKSECSGSIAECLLAGGDEELDSEFAMDSESHRRILATTRYISYGALSRNSVPCSRRGASYYNCRPGAQANPYSRGCSTITRCRR